MTVDTVLTCLSFSPGRLGAYQQYQNVPLDQLKKMGKKYNKTNEP